MGRIAAIVCLTGTCVAALWGCSAPPEPVATRLIDLFDATRVAGTPATTATPTRTEFRFDGAGTLPPAQEHAATYGFRGMHGIRGLSVADGLLVGSTEDVPILVAPIGAQLDADDLLHAVEIRMRASKGERVGVSFSSEGRMSEEAIIDYARGTSLSDINAALSPGDELATVTLAAASGMIGSQRLADMDYIIVRPTEASGADFAIESLRIISRKEHLASIASGVGWHGLAEVFREAVVARAPERIRFDVELPSRPFLDLAIGTIDDHPVTFQLSVSAGSDERTVALTRSVTRAGQWETVPVDLAQFAGQSVTLEFALASEQVGAIGYWGTPVIRNRGGQPDRGESTPARDALVGASGQTPQGVILIIADTLRRDFFLPPYGHERENAPVISRLAASGALFEDNISQGSWTKVSVTSILTSLYPATHGVTDIPDRIPASVTTLAEIYQQAGYATFATSSVPFSGKLTNLHQGVEVLHEVGSVTEVEPPYQSKTARPFTNRLLDWLEEHQEVPFFARLHIMDPHSPFRPLQPYDTMYLEPDEIRRHEEEMETVKEFIELDFYKVQSLPDQEELERAGLDVDVYTRAEKAWYDASIRAMDAELGRLFERLDELNLSERTLVVLMSDHGEEFREHGRIFHGHSAYGELLNVPLMMWGPGTVPAGRVVRERTQSIDVMPTLLDLSRLPVPEQIQGQSLVPLLAETQSPNELGWRERPAFAHSPIERTEIDPKGRKKDAYAMIADDWKLIKNGERPEGWPELELYHHRDDPLNANDVAAEHPEIVARMEEQLDAWLKASLAVQVSADDDVEGMSSEDLERLRSLGYVQ